MTLTITIDMDNAAFDDNGPHLESARILRAVALKLEQAGQFARNPGKLFSLMDSNGNKVGQAEVSV